MLILITILRLANKQDQASALDESEIVQHFNLEELVNRYHVPCRVVRSHFKIFVKLFKLIDFQFRI